MAANKQITPAEHREQIEKYTAVLPRYAEYAEVLKGVLENACQTSFPEALVQSRPKSVSSFAEKAARKYEKYPDAVNQMTDLCGARVIVQTTEQVQAVKQFIEANFQIHESDEKGVLLGEDKFGYRDMHYIVQLRPDGQDALDIAPDKRKHIGDLKAEVQVRTWLQHAWADTLHDRLYKNPLKLSSEIKRAGNLLAALMEEGDRNYNVMAHELDGMIANYTAFATRGEVEKEIEVQELILANEPKDFKKAALALKLARLLAACGQWDRVVKELDPHRDIRTANRCELLQDLGYALCKLHGSQPQSAEYQRGLQLLQESQEMCVQPGCAFVPHLRKRESLHARALSRLGWALQRVAGREYEGREYLRKADEHEPRNPYYLADMLGAEIRFMRQAGLPDAMRAVIRQAINTCREHAVAGIELPSAFFAAGRLSLLLNEPLTAMGYYARGIGHVLEGKYCVPPDALECEVSWLWGLDVGQKPPAVHQWVLDLLAMADRLRTPTEAKSPSRVLIVSGGAASIDRATLALVRPLLQAALEPFAGVVISGGTMCGVPGCVGEVAAALAAKDREKFELLGYIPAHLPHDAPKDGRYNRHVTCGQDHFSPEQILRAWQDLLDAQIHPKDVVVLGFGGGPISMLEYHLGLAFGASVAVITGTGGAVESLLKDELWRRLPNLLPLPCDAASVRAVVAPPEYHFPSTVLEQMAVAFHENYVAQSTSRLPDNMKPWPKLAATYQKANLEQARYAVQILAACGFDVRAVSSPAIFQDFSDLEIDKMAEMEHGRWNVERLRNGWRYGPRDDKQQLHNCLVPWTELLKNPDNVARYDREAVRKFPEILAKAGLEVYRR